MTGLTKTNTWGEERKLFVLLLVMQLAMVLVLTLIALSPWYSTYFNKMMRIFYVQAHRVQHGSHESLAQASKYSALSNNVFPDLELTEELARLGGTKEAGAAEKKLLSLSKSRDEAIRNIASAKSISLELLLARKALKQGNIESAKRNLRTVMSIMRTAPTANSYPRTAHIRTYLSLSLQLARMQKDEQRCVELESEQKLLDDVVSAKRFYEISGIDGYENDYPASLRIQALVSQSEHAKRNDLRALHEALSLCVDASVPMSTRVPVFLHALAKAQADKDIDLGRRVLKAWYESPHELPASKEEARMLLALLLPSEIERNAVIGDELLNGLVASINRSLLSDESYSDFVANITRYCLALNLVYPNADEGRKKLDQVEQLLQYCKKTNADDRGLLAVKSSLLLRLGKMDDGHKILMKLLAQKNALENNRELLLASNVRVYANSLAVKDRAAFLEKAIAMQTWSLPIRKDLLLDLAAAFQSSNQEAKWNSVLSELYGDSHREAVTNPLQVALDEYRLRSLVLQGKPVEAGKAYRSFKTLYSKNMPEWESLCHRQISWLRAYAQYGDKYHANAVNGLFPDECFREAVRVSGEVFGKDAAKHSECLLYLAEYEFCRGKNEEAKAICELITSKWTAQNSNAYLAAMDLSEELAGHPVALKGSYHAYPGSREQLDNLHSIYSSAGNEQAKSRMEKMLPLVKED